VHSISDVRQIELYTIEPLVPDPSPFQVEIAITKLKKHKSPGSDQILAELIQAGGKILLSVIHKHIHSVWNKEELPDQWEEYNMVPIYKKGDNIDCSNYCGISMLSTSYKILSNIHLSRLSPYIDEGIVDHQCGF
jgi:sorting nexin-29